jgi:ATP-binding cassette subfamily B protein
MGSTSVIGPSHGCNPNSASCSRPRTCSRAPIRENIRYGRLDATDAEIEDAARKVNADAFIRALDNGYESQVGEGGNRLSTGQRQLISFARALLADPQLFVMDEATSSIDTETEQLIQKRARDRLRGHASVLSSHTA